MDTPFVHRFQTVHQHYLYDVGTSGIIPVPKEVYDCFPEDGDHNLEATEQNLTATAKAYIAELLAAGMLSSKRPSTIEYPVCDSEWRDKISNQMEYLILSLTEQCNLRCKYCPYQLQNTARRNYSNRKMTWDIARKSIDIFLECSKEIESPLIGYYGGEPLVAKDLLIRATEYAKQISAGVRELRFRLTTNGTLLDRQIVEYLIENQFDLAISLDGPEDLHDEYRVFPGNRGGSYSKIMRGLELIEEISGDFVKDKLFIQTTLPPARDFRELRSFFDNHPILSQCKSVKLISMAYRDTCGLEFCQPAIDLHLASARELRKEFIDRLILGLSSVSKAASSFDNLFAESLVKLHKRQRFAEFSDVYHPGGLCMPGVRRLFITAEGRFFPCERVDSRCDALCLGDVSSGLTFERISKLIAQYSSSTGCERCWANRICGICYASSTVASGFDVERKMQNCSDWRKRMDNLLRLYCEIVEANPSAFDFAQEYEFA